MSRCSRVFIALIAAIIGLTTAPSAQPSENAVPVLPTTSSEAIALALQNRTELRIENMHVAIKETGLKIAKSAFLPTLDFLTEARHTKLYDRFTGSTVTVDVAGQIYTADINQSTIPYEIDNVLELKYNLYSGGKDAAGLKEARANQAGAEYRKNAMVRKVVLDVMTAYWGLRKTQIAFNIAERWKDYYLTSLDIAEVQLKAGRISALEKELAELRVREQELVVTQSKRELAHGLKKYLHALGLKYQEDLGDVLHMQPLTDDPDQDIALPGTAQQQHPELLQIEADIHAAKARITSERAEFLPKIDLFAKYRNAGRDSDTFDNAYDDLHRNDFIVGLQLRMNLFEGFKTWHRSGQAALEAESARMRLEQKENELSLLMSEKSMKVDKVKDDLILAQQRLRISETREKIARVQQQAGKFSGLEYRKEQVSLQEDTDKVLLARIELALAKLGLLLASTY